MKTSDFYYELPEELIAQHPLSDRSGSRLMALDGKTGEVSHMHFSDLPSLLHQGDVLVINNTKVIPARLLGVRSDTGSAVELLLLRRIDENHWETLARPGKKIRPGKKMTFLPGKLTAECEEVKEDGNRIIRFDFDGIWEEILDEAGTMPLPPYIHEQLEDQSRYQTVYAKETGSAAAPTAGLHFTPEVLSAIDAKGIEREEVTLHVGAGTFRPVKSENVADHEMHSEHISVTRDTILRLIAHEGKAIAVGTTSVRTLESLYYVGCKLLRQPDLTEEQLDVAQWEPYEEESEAMPSAKEALQAIVDWLDRHQLTTLHTATRIIIVPGYRYHIVQMLITNFHQPQSTLLLLVSAFLRGDWRRVYDYALSHDFRFLSYGDSSLLIP